jgi:hypothetical protein
MIGNLGIRLHEWAGRHQIDQRSIVQQVKEQWAAPNLFKWETK